jgi:Putative Actinobacterial Holin-X, holin superfamily III
MAAMERANEIVTDSRGHTSEAQWAELVSRAVNDLSRIVHAEMHLAELGIKSLIEQEIDRSLSVAIALGFLLCAAVCTVGSAVIGLHAWLGLWWAAFAIVAAISGVAGIGFLWSARRRPERASSS